MDVASFLGLSASKFSKFSSQNQNFVSFKISKILSELLSSKSFSQRALGEFFSNIFFRDDSSNLSASGSSSNLEDLLGELKSSDGDDLSLDIRSVNKDSLVVENINNSCEFALERSVVDSCDAADFDELGISLNQQRNTIFNCDLIMIIKQSNLIFQYFISKKSARKTMIYIIFLQHKNIMNNKNNRQIFFIFYYKNQNIFPLSFILFITINKFLLISLINSHKQQIYMLKHSKTSDGLLTQLSKMKQSKKEISQKLKDSIIKNSDLCEEEQQHKKRFNQMAIINRHKSIDLLEKKLVGKVKNDEQNSIKLTAVEEETIKKRLSIQKKLEQINNRNQQRLKELKDIQEKVLKKLHQDIEKNQAKEKNLRLQHNRLKNVEKKTKQTKVFQRKQAFEQWRVIQSQKWRLQSIVRQQQQRQKILTTQKNPIPNRKQQKKKSEEKYIPTQKQYNRLKKPQKIDSKQMGKQYLQQAKLMHRQQMNKKYKKKLMNLNLKVINYNQDILQKIFRNTSDLSNLNKALKEKLNAEQQILTQRKEVNKEAEIVTPLPKQKFQFKLSQDLETAKYLKQIRMNLQEIDRLNKPNNNSQQLSLVPNNQQRLILPSTLQ